MAINTKVILLILLAGVFLVSGCVTPQAEKKISDFGFLGGDNALELKFLPQQPPDKIPETAQFDIALSVENVGEHTIDLGKLVIEGLDATSYSLIVPKNNKLEPGSSQDILNLVKAQKITSPEGGSSIVPGGQDIIIFGATAPKVLVTQPSPATIRATALYEYETIAVTIVCLKESVLRQTIGDELCKVSEKKPTTTSAGPIKINSVEQTISGLLIEIQNIGDGNPFVRTSHIYDADLPGNIDSFGELNHIDLVTAEIGSGKAKLDCKLINDVRTIRLGPEGKAQISCTTDFKDVKGEFTDTLILKFKYGYKQSITTQITVTDVPGLN
ncbi:MAG: hypothetical protein AABW84_02450 [Nanoarchaeota archaeon]